MNGLGRALYAFVVLGVIAMIMLFAICGLSGLASLVFLILAFIHRHEPTTFYLWWQIISSAVFALSMRLIFFLADKDGLR